MAKGLDVSEKSDLWVPTALALAGVGLAAWNAIEGRTLPAVAAAAVGVPGALVCLPLRMRRGQARVVGFGAGVALLLAATVPGAARDASAAAAFVVLGAALLAPLPPSGRRLRLGLLLGAALLAALGALAAAGALPRASVWILLAGALHLALQAFHARPRRVQGPPPGPRVCVLGGSFDPWHQGHRVLAEAALKVVDRLLVVPAGQAPHKRAGKEPTEFHHRVAMARLGVEGLARTEVLEAEGRRPGPSYTVETLELLRSTHPAGTRFLLLLGADMYQDLPNWRDWERILDQATLLVAPRPGYDLDPPPELEGRNVALERLAAPALEVSSTALRAALAEGASVGDRMSPAVLAYVRDHELYAGPPA